MQLWCKIPALVVQYQILPTGNLEQAYLGSLDSCVARLQHDHLPQSVDVNYYFEV